MKKLLAHVILAATVAATGHALAHGQKAKHGGIVQIADDLNFELVRKEDKAVIYIYDHGDKLPTAGMTGKLTVLQGSERKEVALEPSGDNTLSSTEKINLLKGTKAIASLTTEDKQVINVRFSVK